MQKTVVCIDVNKEFESVFTEKQFDLSAYGGMFISPQQSAVNFRYRMSKAGYQSDWHVAGDPTLIIVQQGTMQISLRNNVCRQFAAGDCFIAADYLPEDMALTQLHGHKAEVLGDHDFYAIHIKLARRLR